MKKAYIQPNIDITQLEMLSMIATSNLGQNLGGAYEYNSSTDGELGSRDDDIFDLASGLPGMPDY